MNTKKNVKTLIFVVVLFVLLLSTAQAINASVVKKTDNSNENRDWYWKSSYPNYAPQGMPDFNQQQDHWKKISPGSNGVIDSTVAGDDLFNTDENCIAPGPDCYLNSTVAGDDVEEWIFCGPVAVANCFWWFDSKFADPTGIPGDGEDQFALIEDYGSGDDHTTANAPLLIEKLARAMNTTEKGTTYIDDMNTTITNWLTTTGLTNKFTVQTYNRPTFSVIENEIEQNQNVILLLGSYDYIIGNLTVDQAQLNGPHNDLLQTTTWWDFQSFTPSVQRLDTIEVLLVSNSPNPCDVQVDVYNTLYGNALETKVVNPGYLAAPMWVRFDFNPSIQLTPGSTYYFDVLQLDSNYHYEWMYDVPNPYPSGQGWMNNASVDPYGNPFDWAFQTEYFSPPPHSERHEGHFVTCAGVNSAESRIAFSDPTLDVTNPSSDDHNDAANISHDIYNVSSGSPQTDIDCQWWLTDYNAGYNYTVVEQAVVVCPIPDTTPPTLEITKPVLGLYLLNREIIQLPGGTLIIGKIDVDVTANDDDSGIDRVEFYVNDDTLQGSDTTAPYSWLWNQTAFFRQTLIVKAFDKEGNFNSQEIEVWKFF
jgi:hypothetical protein